MFPILSILSIITSVHCAAQGPIATANTATTDQLSLNQDKQCPLLFYYDNKTKQCECQSNLLSTHETVVTCDNDRAVLSYNFCITHNEVTNTVSASFCSYFELSGHNISEPGFINLPTNISELNDCMCGLMNRKGIVCSECIDGYEPSVTSPKFRCSNCSNTWYGVPLYLLLELVPVSYYLLPDCAHLPTQPNVSSDDKFYLL